MRLFIAEKPSLGREIAKNLGSCVKKDGYIEVNGGDDIVTWEFGHILQQLNPDEYDEKYKKWVMSDLPIIPAEWKLKVKKDAKAQFKVIKELLAKADYVVNAGDPDREGQLLVDELLEYLKNKKPTKRILLNALDEKSVKAALADLRDNKEFEGLRDSARARSQADWLVGMNLSRAYTLKSQAAGYEGAIHVGRVQTPTLALIVRREEEIKNFKPTTHYVTEVVWKHDNGLIPTTWKFAESDNTDSEGRLLNKNIADGLLTKIQVSAMAGDAKITSVEQKNKQEGQRLPYSLSSLQVEAGRKYGLNPQQVLDTMQSLYEKKLTTYPRSDCEYLPTNQLEDSAAILKNLASISNDGLADIVAKADKKIVSRVWNDKKISAHHAIIPTTVKPNLDSLSDTEKKMFLLVAKAYIAQFYPIHTYQATKIIVTCAGEEFVGNGKVVLTQGWKAIYAKDSNNDEEESPVLPKVSEGDTVAYESGTVKEKVTTPPKRFTESTLLQAMKQIAKYVKNKNLAAKLKECKGIGTEATRAGIIETLKKADFVSIEKKFLVPTNKGTMAIKVLPDVITYPDTTAVWEAELDDISDGKMSLANFVKHQTEIINGLLDNAKSLEIATNKDVVACPNCGKPMKRRKGANGYFWGCTGYPQCKTTFPDKKGKPDMTQKKSAATAKTAECPKCGKELRQYKGKFGVFWSCVDRDNCGAKFPDNKDKPVIVKCPSCGKGYLQKMESKKTKGKFFWYCDAKCGADSVWDKNGNPDLK